MTADNYIAELPFGAPKIDDDAFVAPTAVVVGAVTMGAGSSIWYGAVARADAETIDIGAGSIVAAGAVVTPNTTVPPGSVVAGVPAKVVRQTTDDDLAHIRGNAESYTRRLPGARRVRPVVRRPLPAAGLVAGDGMY